MGSITYPVKCVGSSCSPSGGKEEVAGNNSYPGGHTWLLDPPEAPWAAWGTTRREGSLKKDPGWGWRLASLQQNTQSNSTIIQNAPNGVRVVLPGVGMVLCGGEVARPKWLALTEGTLSWSMPTGLRFMSFILQHCHLQDLHFSPSETNKQTKSWQGYISTNNISIPEINSFFPSVTPTWLLTYSIL